MMTKDDDEDKDLYGVVMPVSPSPCNEAGGGSGGGGFMDVEKTEDGDGGSAAGFHTADCSLRDETEEDGMDDDDDVGEGDSTTAAVGQQSPSVSDEREEEGDIFFDSQSKQ